jgi:hypothetical protein
VTCSGFAASNATVNITMAPVGNTVLTVVLGTAVADGNGIVNTTVPVPVGTVAGNYIFGCNGPNPDGGITTATSGPTAVHDSGMVVTLSPTNGPTGTSVDACVEGFPRNDPAVAIAFYGTPLPDSLTTDGGGNGCQTVAVPDGVPAGSHYFELTSSLDSSRYADAAFTVTVVGAPSAYANGVDANGYGAIWATSDQGSTWQEVFQLGGAGDGSQIDKVIAINASEAYAYGSNQTTGDAVILFTKDGGTSWNQSLPDASGGEIDGLQAVSADHVYAYGRDDSGDAAIWTTTNGSSTTPTWTETLAVTAWPSTESPHWCSGYADGLTVVNASRAYFYGNYGCNSGGLGAAELWVTNDGGASWQESLTVPGSGTTLSEFGSLTVATTSVAYITSNEAANQHVVVWVTADGGATWSATLDATGTNTNEEGSIQAIVVASATQAYALGADGSVSNADHGANGAIWVTNDSGAHWTKKLDNGDDGGVIEGGAAIDATHAYVHGTVWNSATSLETDKLWVTADGGLTWTPELNLISFGHFDGIIPTGSSGTAYAYGSVDTVLNNAHDDMVLTIWKTTDGSSWTTVFSEPAPLDQDGDSGYLAGITVASPTQVYAWGNDPGTYDNVIWVTTDSGAHWHEGFDIPNGSGVSLEGMTVVP